MKIPKSPLGLMSKIYRHVLPEVHRNLNYWKKRASEIPNSELRKQALESIRTKTFHCEGGGIYSLLAEDNFQDAVSFIVAYQTISDYLDNLCDRSTSLDPQDFRALHESMHHALTPGSIIGNYYRHRIEQEDGGYLGELVQTCQSYLEKLPQLDVIQPALWELEGYYSDLQVYKHVTHGERVPRLQEWFKAHQQRLPEMTWYEFSACSGSTLGIFCIVSYALARNKMTELVNRLKDGYFPWVQGLHILLDYFVDQDEDKLGGDLNFCFYYENETRMIQRFHHFIEQSDQSIRDLPDKNFHRMINRGLLGIYLADRKVKAQKNVRSLARKIMSQAGGAGLFFFVNGWIYRRLKPGV